MCRTPNIGWRQLNKSTITSWTTIKVALFRFWTHLVSILYLLLTSSLLLEHTAMVLMTISAPRSALPTMTTILLLMYLTSTIRTLNQQYSSIYHSEPNPNYAVPIQRTMVDFPTPPFIYASMFPSLLLSPTIWPPGLRRHYVSIVPISPLFYCVLSSFFQVNSPSLKLFLRSYSSFPDSTFRYLVYS